jgi:hypothetical protein
MNSDFKDLLALFNQFGVKYMVAGGYAVMLYAEPRYTKDLDIVIGVSEADIVGVAAALAEFGFPMSESAQAELRLPNRMIAIGRPPSRIDILNELTGVEFLAAWGRRRIVDIDGTPVPFLSLADLVDAKRGAGRPQDLLDLVSLETLLNKQES